MPIMICETAQRLESATRKALAKSITESVHDVIGSDLDLISVVFHELEQTDLACRRAFARRLYPLLHSRGTSRAAQDGVGATCVGRVA